MLVISKLIANCGLNLSSPSSESTAAVQNPLVARLNVLYIALIG